MGKRIMHVLALIPARGGSKGIPRKNLKLMAGKPLVQYTIERALEAVRVDRVVVSTDDTEIAEVARRCGAEVPFLRPEELSGDNSPEWPMMEHCLDFLERAEGWKADLLVYLRPTMPLRNPGEIDKAVTTLLSRPDLDCVRTTRPAPYPPYWMYRRDKDGLMEPFDPCVKPFQYSYRQDLPEVICADGSVDVTRVEVLRKIRRTSGGRVFALHRDEKYQVDIDTLEDWEFCEYLLKRRGLA